VKLLTLLVMVYCCCDTNSFLMRCRLGQLFLLLRCAWAHHDCVMTNRASKRLHDMDVQQQ